MSIGFDHSRLLYIFDKETFTQKVRGLQESTGTEKSFLLSL